MGTGLWDEEYLKTRWLILGGRYLPYNPKLKDRAKEMRKNATFTEKVIWEDYLRKFNKRGENKLSILRQKVIDNYIVDFYVPSIKLVIEIDWEIHNTKVEYDKERTQILEWYWLTEVRFTNDEINNNFITVCETLDNLLITK